MYAGTDDHEPRVYIAYYPNSWNNAVIRAFIEHYFDVPVDEVEKHKRYRIYRHHFHPSLLRYLLGDMNDEKPNCEHKISMPLPASIAATCGISGIINQHRIMPDGNGPYVSPTVWESDRDATKYVAVPNYGKENYRHLLNGLSPRRELVREVSTETDRSSSRPPKSRRLNNSDGDSTRTFHICIGINSSRVTEYANKSNINRGKCLQHWDFSHGAWRSKECEFSASEIDYQCDHCKVALSHVTASRCPELFHGTCVEQIVDSVSNIRTVIANHHFSINDEEEFFKSSEAKSLLTILHDIHNKTEDVQLSEGKWLVRCPGFQLEGDSDQCNRASIRERRLHEESYCAPCLNRLRNFRRRSKRAQETADNPADPSSNTNWRYLSDEVKQERIVNLKKKQRLTEQSLSRAKKEIASSDNTLQICVANVEDGGQANLVTALTDASEFVGKNLQLCKSKVIEAMLVSEIGQGKITEEISSKVNELAETVVLEISNIAKKLKGQKNFVDLNPHVTRACLSLWATNKSCLRDLRASLDGLVLISIPSEGTLRRLDAACQVNEGVCPKIFGWIADEINRDLPTPEDEGDMPTLSGLSIKASRVAHNLFIAGQVLSDEMYLKDGITVNPLTGKATGWITKSETFSLTDAMGHLLTPDYGKPEKVCSSGDADNDEDNSNENDLSLATSCNQWMFRDTKNNVRRLNFFFNSSDLSGDEVLRQKSNILCDAALVGLCPVMNVFDAGGANYRAATLDRDGQRLGNEAKIPRDLIIYKNSSVPFDQEMVNIFCQVHGLKNNRNGLESKKRNYISADGHSISWKVVEDMYLRDMHRVEVDHTARVTSLSKAAVIPDYYSKTSVSNALAVFKPDAIGEQMTHCATALGIAKDLVLPKDVDTPTDPNSFAKMRRMTYMLRMKQLKEAARQPGVTEEIKCQVDTLELMVHYACIFNEFFLRKGVSITPENIDLCEKEMIEHLQYFENWRKVAKTRKTGPGDRTWEKTSLHTQTFNIMRLTVCSFFEGCRILFRASHPPSFVPVMHSNQSILEASNSFMRAHGFDTPHSYGRGIGVADLPIQLDGYQQRAKMYPSVTASTSSDKITGRTDAKREMKLKEWHSKQTRPDSGGSGEEDAGSIARVSLMDAGISSAPLAAAKERMPSVRKIRCILLDAKLDEHFDSVVSSDEIFLERAKISIGHRAESWFKFFFSMSKDDRDVFDAACQRFTARIFCCWEAKLGQPEKSANNSFWYHFDNYKGSNDFKTDKTFLPIGLRCHEAIIALLHTLVPFVEDMIQTASASLVAKRRMDASRKKRDEQAAAPDSFPSHEEIDIENQNHEVMAFVGYAINRSITMYERVLPKSRDQLEKNDKILTYLRKMRIRHADALADEEYMDQYYSTSDQITNLTGLTLVSKQYQPFSRMLMRKIRGLVNMETVGRSEKDGGENSLNEFARNEIFGDKELYEAFLAADDNDKTIPNSTKLSLFKRICRSAFNPRCQDNYNLYAEQHTSIYSRKSKHLAFRTEMEERSRKIRLAKSKKLDDKVKKMKEGEDDIGEDACE